MKLQFKMRVNTIRDWYRPCYHCRYFSYDMSIGLGRQCYHPDNSKTIIMTCYNITGKKLQSKYLYHFTRIKTTKL